MIIGNGDIAKTLKRGKVDETNRLYFASGVSNSHETRESEYQREKDLLANQPKDIQLVYFSSLCVFYSDTRYARHKMEMEALVKEFPHYVIVRLGNITWGDNPHILINYMKRIAKEKGPGKLWDVTRYVIEESEFLHWVGLIPHKGNWEMNITGRKMSELQIFREFVSADHPIEISEE